MMPTSHGRRPVRATCGLCVVCGHDHRHVADMHACDAIHGLPWGWPPDVRDPQVICCVCGLVARMSIMVRAGGHMEMIHSTRPPRTGHLLNLLEPQPARVVTHEAGTPWPR